LQNLLSANGAQGQVGAFHGVLRGTFEMALSEAQSGRLLAGPGQHAQALREAVNALSAREQEIVSLLREIVQRDYWVGDKLSDGLRPLLQLARQRIDLANRVLGLLPELVNRFGQRLAGSPIVAGARSAGSLVSSQLSRWGGQVRTLLPQEMSLMPWVRQILDEIESVPTDAPSAARQAAGAAAAVRIALQATAGRLAASAIWRFFSAALQALWSVGGRLISIPIILLDEKGNPIGMPQTAQPGGQTI
jgi:hypothetical protein